jgi:hypothetical protein
MVTTLIKKIYQKCCVMQWSIGFAAANINDVISNKAWPNSITWLPIKHSLNFIADPFIIKNKQGKLFVLYEDFSAEQNGYIAIKELDEQFNTVSEKTLLKTNTHLSYPFIFEEAGVTYIIPETQQTNNLIAYPFNIDNLTIEKGISILSNTSILDATFLKHDNKYWIFASVGDGKNFNNQLNIYYANSLFGNYLPHQNNPVKNNLDGSRPAGAIIQIDGIYYRPAQNCKAYYGQAITINKIKTLTTTHFEEEVHCVLSANTFNYFTDGVHTINSIKNEIVVIDGIKMIFMPLLKLKLFIKAIFGKPIILK